MADGILLERAGVPTVSICTESFRITADAMAGGYGFPGFQYALTPHPVASLTRDQIQDRVVRLMPRLLEILGVGQ